MKKLLCFSVVLASAVPTPAISKVKILDRSFSSSEVCPGANSRKCIMKSSGATGTYVGNDRRYLNLDARGEPLVGEYIGHLFTRSLDKAEPYCGNSGTDTFAQYARSSSQTHVLVPYEYSFTIKEKASKLLGVGADVNAVEAATAAGIPAASLEQVAAAISASYNRIRNRNVELKGIFRYYEINPDILTNFNSADGAASLRQCRKWLTENDREVIVGLTGYKLLDATATLDLSSKFASDLKARLGNSVSDNQIAALTASFTSNLERRVEGRFRATFELLAVAIAP